MFIYDSTSIAFIKKAEQFIKEILISCGITVKRSRFLFKGYLNPINVVIYEGKDWAHFNPSYLQIELNRSLIYQAKDSVLRDILKHELAHYLTYIQNPNATAHGKEFQETCRLFGFPKEVSKATMNIDECNLAKEGDIDSEKILEKVKKLFMLGQSSNHHEAELATLKANEILLRHNLSYVGHQDTSVYLERLLVRKRQDIKLTAIYNILHHFIVRPVISHGKDTCCLEVSGSLTNVKLASYVANFLDQELERLWEITKKQNNFKGIKAKNSFFLGVSAGFNQKMKNAKKSYTPQEQKALVLVEEKLTHDTQIIYGRLSKVNSGHKTDLKASAKGHETGLSLTIRRAVEGEKKNLLLSSSH